MENFFSRYRNASILVLVVLAQVLGLATQVKRSTEAGGTRLLRVWVVSAVTPLERALVDSGQAVRNVWRNYIYLRGVRHENRDLKEQLDRMRIEQVRLTEDAAQARRLQSLLGFKEQFISRTLAAQVIGSSGSDQSRVLYIDKGSNDGVRVDMAVITPDGIVGKVLRVFPISSQVLMINDASSGVGAILEKSRLQGIVQGSASGETMLRYVMSDEKVEPGERIVASGGDRIFPKGLPVGTVIQSNPGSDLFLNIRVKPAADLSRLEEVLVVTKITDTTPATEEASGRIRAADILAQRLPSVPQKPAGAPAPGAAASAANTTAPNAASAPAAKPAVAGVNPANATAAAPASKPATAAGAGTSKPSTTAAAPASAPSSRPATKTTVTSPQAGASVATPRLATNPSKPSPTAVPRIISDESATASPSTKPAGAAPKSSTTTTGDPAKKPALVKPTASTNATAATEAAQKPKLPKPNSPPTKPANPAQPPQPEEPSR